MGEDRDKKLISELRRLVKATQSIQSNGKYPDSCDCLMEKQNNETPQEKVDLIEMHIKDLAKHISAREAELIKENQQLHTAQLGVEEIDKLFWDIFKMLKSKGCEIGNSSTVFIKELIHKAQEDKLTQQSKKG